MKNFLKLDIRSTLKRIFGSEKKAERAIAALQAAGKSSEDKAEFKIETELPVTLSIWTIERNRYAAARALCTEVEVFPSAAISLCEDINGYVLDTPNGESVVVEARTGSLVGHSLEIVKDGIREMTRAQLNNQLDTGKKEFSRMKKQELSNEEFWKAIKMGSSDLEIAQDYQE
jgi:hypothetical protein